MLVVCGVSGSGKTTVGRRVAARLGVPFADADDFHAPEAIAKMQRGEALTDADRTPWLDRLAAVLHGWQAADTGGVLACSALRQTYRRRLAQGLSTLRFVLLTATAATLRSRLRTRSGHFFAPALLDSQLATLEPAPDLPALTTDDRTPEAVTEAVIALLRGPSGSASVAEN